MSNKRISEDSFTKEILKRLCEAKHLAEKQLEKSETKVKWDVEWDGETSRTSNAYRKYKADLLLVERLKKTIQTVMESASYAESKGYLRKDDK